MTPRRAVGTTSVFLAAMLVSSITASVNAQYRQAEIMIDSSKIHGFALGYLNDDTREDRAILVENDDGGGADLLIVFGSGRDEASRMIIAPDIAWVGGMAGQKPSLELRDNGSLVVVSQNETIGRDRWRLELTIAYRNGEMLVGGFTMATRDSVDPESGSLCDINLFTGRGFRNEEAITTALRASPVEQWNMDRIPEECSQS
jgi:hypothetical protein